MREFKFRAWFMYADKDKMQEVCELNYIMEGHLKGIMKVLTKDYLGLQNSFDPEYQKSVILMQYTGFKDGQGKEIYEGDILEEKLRGISHLFEVKFDDGMWKILPISHKSDWTSSLRLGGNPSDSFSSIVGNIYENPELIWNILEDERTRKKRVAK